MSPPRSALLSPARSSVHPDPGVCFSDASATGATTATHQQVPRIHRQLHSPTAQRGVVLDLFAMTGSEWAQAAPYALLSLYAIAALVSVLGLVAVHADERDRLRRTGWSPTPATSPRDPWCTEQVD